MQEQTSIPRVHSQQVDVSATLDFLKRVLPPEGDHWYVAAIFDKGKVNHQWHREKLALASCLIEADRSGATAYHACAVYRARDGGRKAKNSAGASSFWTDIDAGEGKQFDTADSAHDALVDFCKVAGLTQAVMRSAPVSVFMRIGRWTWFLILKRGKTMQPGLQHFLENTGLGTNAQPTSRPYSVHREHTTGNVSQEPLGFCNERALSNRSVREIAACRR